MADNKKPTRKEVQETHCWLCSGHYMDGRVDCENRVCPSYTYMPYRKLEPDLKWFKYNPKRKGRVTWEESAKSMTDEQREANTERLRLYRERQNEDDN